jgi:hypothetical protein
MVLCAKTSVVTPASLAVLAMSLGVTIHLKGHSDAGQTDHEEDWRPLDLIRSEPSLRGRAALWRG